MEELQLANSRQVQDMEASLEDKGDQVKQLIQQVRYLQADGLVLEPLSRPPGSAHRTASVGVQTSALLHHLLTPDNMSQDQTGAAPILPLGTCSVGARVEDGDDDDEGPANMTSLSSVDAVCCQVYYNC